MVTLKSLRTLKISAAHVEKRYSSTEVPILGYICLSEEVHLLYSRNKFTLRHKNGVYLYSFKILQILLKIQQVFVILFNFVVIRNFRASCSSVKMVKGCMFRERLGTPAIVEIEPSFGSSWPQH